MVSGSGSCVKVYSPSIERGTLDGPTPSAGASAEASGRQTAGAGLGSSPFPVRPATVVSPKRLSPDPRFVGLPPR